jgi:hypothetical protein
LPCWRVRVVDGVDSLAPQGPGDMISQSASLGVGWFDASGKTIGFSYFGVKPNREVTLSQPSQAYAPSASSVW